MHNEEHLNLVLIMEYFGIICECDIQLTEPNANKKEINATKKKIKNDIKKFLPAIKKALRNPLYVDKAELFYYMALCYEILENKSKVLKCYKEASKRDLKYIINLASFKRQNNDKDGALKDLKFALENTSDAHLVESINSAIKDVEESIEFDKDIKRWDKLTRFFWLDLLLPFIPVIFYGFLFILSILLLIGIPIVLIYFAIKSF